MAGRFADVLRAAGRDVFVPLTFGLARALEQASIQDFRDDLGLAAFALRSAQSLFFADGTINWFGGALEGETADAALELARRLAAQTNDGEIVLGYVPGPAGAASLDVAAKAALALCRAYGEAGVSALLVAEDVSVPDAAAYAAALAPVCNLGDYYRMPVVWLSRNDAPADVVEHLCAAGAHVAAALGGSDDLLAIDVDASSVSRYRPGRGRLVLSRWDVAENAEPANVTSLGRAVREGVAR